jgi:hypothetical protein
MPPLKAQATPREEEMMGTSQPGGRPQARAERLERLIIQLAVECPRGQNRAQIEQELDGVDALLIDQTIEKLARDGIVTLDKEWITPSAGARHLHALRLDSL